MINHRLIAKATVFGVRYGQRRRRNGCDENWRVDFSCASSKGSLNPISSPYFSGGVCTGVLHEPTAVNPESGLILLRASLGGPDGAVYAPSGGFREETVDLVVRIYCK